MIYNDLIEFYDNVSGHEPDGMQKIAPVAHKYGYCHEVIETTIKQDGTLADIQLKKKETEPMLLAVTEESASRTSSGAVLRPNGLNDYIYFMVPGTFTVQKCGNGKAAAYGPYNGTDMSPSYQAYKTQLAEWASSENSCPQIKSVLKYISDNDLMEEVLKKYPDPDIEKLMKYTVRWRVLSDDPDTVPETWKNEETLASWTAFYEKKHRKTASQGLDIITGRMCDIEISHPKPVAAYGQAKLISTSTNEDKLLHFTGNRFSDASDKPQISYVMSQKMHNALSWLIRNQSMQISKAVFKECKSDEAPKYLICFSPDLAENTDADDSFRALFGADISRAVDTNARNSKYESQMESVKDLIYKGRRTAHKNRRIILAVFDKSGKGRFSPVMYHTYGADEFFDIIEKWYEGCSWFQNQKSNDQTMTPVPVTDIARCTCGVERISDNGRPYLDVNENIYRDMVKTLLTTVLNNGRIPENIVDRLIQQVAPERFSGNKNNKYVSFNKILRTACAVLHWKHTKEKKGNKDMSLDRENTDRSYLFGRLLAVYDRAENTALNRKAKKNENGYIDHRDTNAMRMWSAYVLHPMLTLKNIQNSVIPYISSLPYGLRTYYQNEIMDIMNRLSPHDNGRQLSPEYIMGYYHEKTELSKKKTKEDDNKADTDTVSDQKCA